MDLSCLGRDSSLEIRKNPPKAGVFQICELEAANLEHLYRSLVYQYKTLQGLNIIQ